MAISMTGFGRGEHKDENYHFTVECKTINHRYLDINIRMPRKISFFEEKIRNHVKKFIKRGRVDIYVGMQLVGESEVSLNLDLNLAKEYFDILSKIEEITGAKNDITVSNISKFPDVIKVEEKSEDEEVIWKSLQPALNESIDTVSKMRAVEGEKLAQDIEMRCGLMQDYISQVEKLSHTVAAEYKEKLSARVKEMLEGSVVLDENRLSQEVAFFADRSSITEEVVRFNSHIIQLKDTIKSNDSIGRKIDFLIQEMNREANTVGSKSSNIEITKTVVEVKSELEKIREQIQNIE